MVIVVAFARYSIVEEFPKKQTRRHRCPLGIALKCRREDKNKVGQETLICEAGPSKALWTSPKVLELDGRSALFCLRGVDRAFRLP